ncbi:MAG: outer membrane beta-barrel protein [Candidatus Kapaibacterium sp.]
MKNIFFGLCAVVLLCGITWQQVFAATSIVQSKTFLLLRSHDMILEPGDDAKTYVGVYGGINYNMHNGTFSLVDGTTTCCTFNNGTGIGAVAGVKAFLPLASNLYFSPRLAYEGRGGTLRAAEYTNDIIGADHIIEKATFRNDLDMTLPTINLDILSAYTFVPQYGVYVAAGVSSGFVLSKNYTESENILAPSGVYYNGTTSTSKEIAQSSFTDFSALQFGVRVGLGAMVSISDNISINPEVLYHVPLTAYTTQYSSTWKTSLIQPTLGILFTL